jgi:hypothetical protein
MLTSNRRGPQNQEAQYPYILQKIYLELQEDSFGAVNTISLLGAICLE